MATEESTSTVLGRLGRVFYWITTAVAVVSALIGLAGWLNRGDDPDSWLYAFFGLLFAGLTWLAGRAVLNILSGR